MPTFQFGDTALVAGVPVSTIVTLCQAVAVRANNEWTPLETNEHGRACQAELRGRRLKLVEDDLEFSLMGEDWSLTFKNSDYDMTQSPKGGIPVYLMLPSEFGLFEHNGAKCYDKLRYSEVRMDGPENYMRDIHLLLMNWSPWMIPVS